jgi:hypothetical protein
MEYWYVLYFDPIVLLFTSGLFLVALLLGRVWVLLFPVVVWSLFYVGLLAGWWGNGVGDGWQLSMIINMLTGEAAAGIGLLLRRLLSPVGGIASRKH